MDINTKREREKQLVSEMISLYCHENHGTKKGHLCNECQELMDYARIRSEKCPFMETKTFCSSCKVHCYKPEMREKIRVVMRYAGPRMLFHHPAPAIRHVIQNKDKSNGNDHCTDGNRLFHDGRKRNLDSVHYCPVCLAWPHLLFLLPCLNHSA
jgi:hypothetical protein